MVVIGDISVGKTNIIKRLMGDDFIPCQATIGVDFTYLENQVKDDEDPKKVNKISLQIWTWNFYMGNMGFVDITATKHDDLHWLILILVSYFLVFATSDK